MSSSHPLTLPQPDYMFKLLLLGDADVGKTSVVVRFAIDRFNPDYVMTIGKLLRKTLQLSFCRVCDSLLCDYSADCACTIPYM